MATLSFKISEQSHTQTSVIVKVTNIKTDAKFKIAYSYYRAGYEAQAVTWRTRNLSKGVTSDSSELLQMLPGKNYTITVKITCNGKTLSKSMKVKTNDMPGYLKMSDIRSSTVVGSLKNLSTYHFFDVEYRFFYRKKGNKTWLKQRYINVPMGETLGETVLYTGLKEKTEYEFLCDAYRNLDGKYSYIRSFNASCTTPQYAPTESIHLGFDKIMVVPNTHKGYVQVKPIPRDYYLFLQKGFPDYTLIRMPSLFAEIYVPDYYGLRAARGLNLVQLSSRYVADKPLNLPTYVQGDPVNVAAADVLKMAKALIDAYEFVSVIENDTSCKEYCERLKEKTSEIEQGGIIKGGDKSILDLIGEMASAILGDFNYDIGDKDSPLSADKMNALRDLVLEALASI